MVLSLYYNDDDEEDDCIDQSEINKNKPSSSSSASINKNDNNKNNNNNHSNKNNNNINNNKNDIIINPKIFNDDTIFEDDEGDEYDENDKDNYNNQVKYKYVYNNNKNNSGNNNNDYKYQKTVPFSSFCELLDRIIDDSKSSNKKMYLSKFFSHYKESESKNYFQLLRLLLPQFDKERYIYGLKEKTLAKLYVELLNISQNSIDATRLLNWKKSTTSNEIGGDFGNAIYLSLKNRQCTSKGIVSIGEINESLDFLSCTTDKKTKILILKKVLRSTTALEQKWFVRIILKEMKMGLSEKSILKFYHPEALDHFNLTSNLRLVCTNLNYMPQSKQRELLDKKEFEKQLLKQQQKQQQHANDGSGSDNNLNIYKYEISLFNPIKPMLANRQTIDNLSMIISGGVSNSSSSSSSSSSSTSQFVIETKFDGERIQIHKDGGEIKFFSRNSNDSTCIYGPMFIPVVKECVLADKCILDGELIVWDSISQRFEDFGNLKTLALNKDGLSGSGDPLGVNFGKQLCFLAFDILFVKDQSVMNLPLAQRMMLLKRCVNVKSKQFEISEQTPVNSIVQVINMLELAIINREEGLMLKNLHSLYVPGERKDKWIKIKPEYIDGMGSGAEDLDLVIIGGYYGTGLNRRGGTISHFMLGIPHYNNNNNDDDDQKNDDNVIFYSFCKVGSGYSDLELKELQKQLDPHWNNFNTNKPPSNIIQLAEPFKEKPDVWIDPRVFSKVLQIKAAQIVVTDKYKACYTLRFPRVLKIRNDKGWKDCCDHNEIIELYNNYSSSNKKQLKFKRLLEDGSFEDGGGGGGGKKEKKKKQNKSLDENSNSSSSSRSNNKVLSIFQDTDTSNIIPSQNIFKGFELCVIKGCSSVSEYSKSRLEIMIVEMGGTKVQYPSKDTNYVISSKEVVKIQNLIRSGIIDIVSYTWLVDCYNEKRLIPLGPKYMIFTTETTKNKFLLDSDPFGDSYFNETNEQSLKDSFFQIDKQQHHHQQQQQHHHQHQQQQHQFDSKKIQLKYFSNCWWTLFKPFIFYLDLYQVVGEESTLIENNNLLKLINLNIKFYGGKVSAEFNKSITHVVIDQSDLSRISFIKNKIKSFTSSSSSSSSSFTSIQIVTTDWIQDSIKNYSIQPILENLTLDY